MTDTGLSLTQQAPATALVTVEVGDRTPTDIWQDIAASRDFQSAIVNAIRVSATGKRPNEFREDLRDRDLPLGFAELGVRIAKGDKRALFTLTYALERLGTGWTSTEDVLRASRLLNGGEQTPTVALRLRNEFFDRRADQRRDVCNLIAALARTCDVQLVASGLVQQKLATKHREDLPGVSDQCNTPRQESPTEELVTTARAEFRHDSTEVAALRELSEDPAETLSYHELESVVPVSDSRIRQCVGALAEHELVDTFDGSSGKVVELLGAGRAFLDALDADIGRQAELGERVSESGKSCIYSRVSTDREGGGDGPADRRRVGELVNVEYMGRWRHAAVTASATAGGVTLLDQPHEPSDELRQPYLSYNDGRLVVGAEYSNPLQYWVSIARALTDRRVWDNVLTPERLDGDVGNLGGLETDDRRILRDARCLGYLPDSVSDGADYAEALMDASDELCTLLRRLKNEDYEDRNSFRGTITAHALGLAGIVTHLCDLADVDLVRELRLPEFSRRFDEDDREDLVETLTNGVAIASRHGHFAAYRQLLESRTDKRSAAMEPTIPADDPTGGLIGSFVIIGDKAESLEDPLRTALNDAQPHEDAPEFEVAVPIQTQTEESRDAYEAAIRHVLEGKDLRSTDAAVSLLHALSGTVYDAAFALSDSLSSEDTRRSIRLDEVRIALANLPENRILPTMTPTIRKTTKALLTAVVPHTRSELAEKAGVSTRSLRTHLPKLEALSLVEETETGFRFTLPFATSEERGEDIAPDIVTSPAVSPSDVLYDLGYVLVADDIHDPEHEMGAPFYITDPVERMDALCDVFGEWATLARRLGGLVRGSTTRTAAFGTRPKQTALSGQGEVAT